MYLIEGIRFGKWNSKDELGLLASPLLACESISFFSERRPEISVRFAGYTSL